MFSTVSAQNETKELTSSTTYTPLIPKVGGISFVFKKTGQTGTKIRKRPLIKSEDDKVECKKEKLESTPIVHRKIFKAQATKEWMPGFTRTIHIGEKSSIKVKDAKDKWVLKQSICADPLKEDIEIVGCELQRMMDLSGLYPKTRRGVLAGTGERVIASKEIKNFVDLHTLGVPAIQAALLLGAWTGFSASTVDALVLNNTDHKFKNLFLIHNRHIISADGDACFARLFAAKDYNFDRLSLINLLNPDPEKCNFTNFLTTKRGGLCQADAELLPYTAAETQAANARIMQWLVLPIEFLMALVKHYVVDEMRVNLILKELSQNLAQLKKEATSVDTFVAYLKDEQSKTDLTAFVSHLKTFISTKKHVLWYEISEAENLIKNKRIELLRLSLQSAIEYKALEAPGSNSPSAIP